jgi:hypothetical protein
VQPKRLAPMRKSFTDCWFVPSALLQLSIVFFFFSLVPQARAQVFININSDSPSYWIAPVFWAPGQNYTAVVTDPNAEFYQTTPPPAASLYIFNQTQYNASETIHPGDPVFMEDPYVTVSPPVYISSSQASLNVSVAAGAPTEKDGMTFVCGNGTGFIASPGFVQITPCALPVTPTITAVSPSTWIAGQPTSVTITGTGFIASNNPNQCTPSYF